MPSLTGTVASTTVIQAPVTPGSYPAGVTPSTHWRIVGYSLTAQIGGAVTDVRIQSYNASTTTATDLVNTGACGVAGGGESKPNTRGCNYGDALPSDEIRIYLGASGIVDYNIQLAMIG
jgi:hypothetical protein